MSKGLTLTVGHMIALAVVESTQEIPGITCEDQERIASKVLEALEEHSRSYRSKSRPEVDEAMLASECCASGRCEVCTPGFEWGRDG